MKKFCIIACFLLGVTAAQAQHQVLSFFDELGTAQIRTDEYSKSHDTIISVFHRIDDVIWSRYVYRIVDMRYKQNYQLYFPTKADDPDYRNLFKVITDAVIDGMPIYERDPETIKPTFATPLSNTDIPSLFMADDPTADYSDDPTHFDISQSSAMCINYDSVSGKFSFNDYSFADIVKNQVKYLIQEVVFFDKHTSRLYTKIMAIAPLHSDKIQDKENIMTALNQSIMFWIPFDQLRPYLAMQYVIPSQNETRRVTFDDFFQKRLYTSYIVGEGNMYNRYIPDYAKTEEEIKKEQQRIEKELLDFEQDLWEY